MSAIMQSMYRNLQTHAEKFVPARDVTTHDRSIDVCLGSGLPVYSFEFPLNMSRYSITEVRMRYLFRTSSGIHSAYKQLSEAGTGAQALLFFVDLFHPMNRHYKMGDLELSEHFIGVKYALVTPNKRSIERVIADFLSPFSNTTAVR